MDPLLLLRTLRHLRWGQLVYRPLRVAQYRFYRTFPRFAARWTNPNTKAPDVPAQTIKTFRAVFQKSFAHLNEPLERYDQRLLDLAGGRFTFLNRTLTIDHIDWNQRYESHLWNYQLHYFSFAVWCARALVERGDERAWRCCQSLIESWIAGARVGRSDGWDAYPVSLRVVNWIYAYALVADVWDDQRFLAAWRTSIYQQLYFLNRHIEFHLLANHVLKNVKALAIGGLFFHHQYWLFAGGVLLRKEFKEQVLNDGGHFERAPMYHAQSLVDFLECHALLDAFDLPLPDAKATESKLRSMAGFLEAMSYGAGTIALFNDSANTEETRPQPILETAKRVCRYSPGRFPRVFPQTGYYLWLSRDQGEKIIVDAGPPAVDYNPAHAHCDLLSYELWLDGEPFIVDSGVHGYGGDRFREYSRSTRAHNTVMFDGLEQSEIWDTFRMARRAKVIKATAHSDQRRFDFCGSFERYDQKVVHERRIHRDAGGEWVITDVAREGDVTLASSFIHLHPDLEARRTNDRTIECRNGSRKLLIEPFADENAEIGPEIIKGGESPIQGWRFPDFGIARPSVTIQFDYRVRSGKEFGYRIKAAEGK
ncbi:MAG: heparinase II/III family protein [Acidobacteria bacterium]|nr:heparinase II/III family protein [Acidobacteriota bacterium]